MGLDFDCCKPCAEFESGVGYANVIIILRKLEVTSLVSVERNF